MATIRVFNLTDVPTPELESSGAINRVIAVWKHLIPPGESVEMDSSEKVLREVTHYISLKMVSVDRLPVEYVVKKEKLQRSGG